MKKTDIARALSEKGRYPVKAITDTLDISRSNQYESKTGRKRYGTRKDDEIYLLLVKEIRRRTRVVGSFPDGNSALMLVAARLRHIAGTKWGMNQYLKMDRLEEEAAENMRA